MFAGEEVMVGHAGDELGGGPLGRGQPGVRLMTVETPEKIHWKARHAPVGSPREQAPVFESLYVYISSGAPSRSVE